MKCTTILGFFVTAVTFSACGTTDPPTSPGGPDFERHLGLGEYQVRVTGDVQRSFETTGATYYEIGSPPFSDGNRATLSLMGDPDALNGAAFDLCSVPFQQATYGFDAVTPFAGCPSDPSRATGGFIVQLGAPQEDELDCYANGYGDKDFDGVLTITSVTDSDIQGEAQGSGTCNRHPHSEVEPMQPAAVSVRIRFRAMRGTP
jgi:hypothetical protein